MDNTNWRNGQPPMVQSQAAAGEQSTLSGSGVAPSMDTDDWRTKLPPDSRPRIVNKIVETLKKHLPFSGQEGLQELKKIAVRFEEKIYSAATSQSDYLRKISLKMLTMETKSQSPMGNSLQANAANASRNSSDLASHSMQSEMHNQGLIMPIVGGQSQGQQQLQSQNIQNNISTAGMQHSDSLTAAVPAVSNLTQGSIANAVAQSSNLESMQNNSSVAQNAVGNSIGHGMPSNVFANSQIQMQGRPQQVVQQQQQNSQHLFYQQQLQQQFMKQKLQSGAIAQPMMQSHVQNQQQQRQNLLQPGQIQSSQKTVMQPSVVQSASISNLQQNQQSYALQTSQQMLQQHQPVLRQHQQQPQQVSILQSQQTSMAQQIMLQAPQQMPQQQQQQPIGQTSNASSVQQNQLMGPQNNIPDLKQQQQHRLIGQHTGVAYLQQQLIGQQNNLPNIHQSQLGGLHGGVSWLQKPAILGTQSVSGSGIQSNQHPVHMLQQKFPVQQQMQQNMTLVQNKTQKPQPQASQHQMVSQIRSQMGQLQNLQQQPNSLQRDIQIPASAALLQQHNLAEHQKQFFQSQRAMAEASSSCFGWVCLWLFCGCLWLSALWLFAVAAGWIDFNIIGGCFLSFGRKR